MTDPNAIIVVLTKDELDFSDERAAAHISNHCHI
jgi:hypothetical protein